MCILNEFIASNPFFATLSAVILGGLITWILSMLYYRKAASGTASLSWQTSLCKATPCASTHVGRGDLVLSKKLRLPKIRVSCDQ